MTLLLLLAAVILAICVALNNASSKVGVPVLLAFILLGIVFGHFGLVPVNTADYGLFSDVCSAALVFIMFYGGFGTNWKTAKEVVTEAGILASAGVFITAAVTGLFCHFALGWGWIEAFLMGSVVSSTDAASVFSILRSRKLGLKAGTAPLLEVESGSNDPCSYMLTAACLSMLGGNATGGGIALMLVQQIALGAGLGLCIATLGVYVMRRVKFASEGFEQLLMVAIALFSYAVPSLVGGNGYLSTYIVGIVLGNATYHGKKTLVHFFDGMTSFTQVLIFFMLGLLAHPSMLKQAALPALAIFLVMLLVSRPVSIFACLLPFKKYRKNFRQLSFVSFVGLRGAASIVFAMMALTQGAALENDIFNIVFCIVLISIAGQGTLIPWMAKKMDMIDEEADVMKTFSDFSESNHMQFNEIEVTGASIWNGRMVMELGLPSTTLISMIIRKDGSKEIPNGRTVIREGDKVIMISKNFSNKSEMHIVEHPVSKRSKWIGKPICEYDGDGRGDQLLLIKRGEENIIPHGNTVLQEGDILLLNKK